jgi:uncharacterized alkaline shock family protein YloU
MMIRRPKTPRSERAGLSESYGSGARQLAPHAIARLVGHLALEDKGIVRVSGAPQFATYGPATIIPGVSVRGTKDGWHISLGITVQVDASTGLRATADALRQRLLNELSQALGERVSRIDVTIVDIEGLEL